MTKLGDMLTQLCMSLAGRIGKFDIVVSRERSGYRVFQMLEENYLKSGVVHVPSQSVQLLNLSGKNVLLFDDTTTTGSDLKEMSEALTKLGAKVETVVYAVLDACPEENRPSYFVKVVNFNEYQELTHMLSEALKDQDSLLDTDHIQVQGNISPPGATCIEIYDSIASIGYVYEGSRLSSGCQFGLSNPDFCRIDSLKMPFVTKDIGTWKLRIKYSFDGRIRIIPLSFPVLDFVHFSCQKTMESPFCEDYGVLFEGSSDNTKLLCCFCVIYNTTSILLRSFFKTWKKMLEARGLTFNLEKVVYEDAKAIFNDQKLEQNLFSEIQKIIVEKEE